MAGLTRTIRDLWATMKDPSSAPATAVPEVIVHDPDADRPHDLDDPFFDREVQARIAAAIASNAAKKR